jgi:hypothetical protein
LTDQRHPIDFAHFERVASRRHRRFRRQDTAAINLVGAFQA